MAEQALSASDLDSVESIFDIFLLLFEWLKEREGEVLSVEALLAGAFDAARQRIYDTCRRLADEDEDFRDTGKLSSEAKQELTAALLELQREGALAACYGALVGIDQAFPPPSRQPQRPLNCRFNERGHVRLLPGANLPYEDTLIRGYAETGTRIENKLQHLTVSFPQRNGYTAELVRLSDFLLALFDDRPSPTFGIVPFRAQEDEPTVEVTTPIPGGGAFFTVHATDGGGAGARLRAVLNRAEQDAIDILVFPELSFTSRLLAQLRADLETRGADFPKLVVAGTLRTDGRNVCHVLGPGGQVLWQQAKMNRFVILPGELESAPEPIPERGGTEDIDISDRVIHIADLPFGRVAVLICLDFILPETYSVLAGMQVNCVIVPAMTPGARRFETLAWAHAAASRATTIFCNAPNCPGFRAEARSFVYTPVRSQDPLRIGDDRPWEHHMLVFSAHPPRCDTVALSD